MPPSILGRFRELFVWSATLPDETRNHLEIRGFKPAELNLADWDMRMLYTMAG
jgi:hypothetical protein